MPSNLVANSLLNRSNQSLKKVTIGQLVECRVNIARIESSWLSMRNNFQAILTCYCTQSNWIANSLLNWNNQSLKTSHQSAVGRASCSDCEDPEFEALYGQYFLMPF